MAYQPLDEVIPHHNDIEFHDIDGRITSFTYSQADNNALIHSDSNDPSSPPITLSALNDLGEISNEIFGPAEELLLAEAFPDAVLGESSLMDSPDDPIDEDTITATAPTGAENDAVNNSPSETNSMADVDEPTAENIPEQINLNSVDIFIQKRLIYVSIHPTQNPRRRYGSEGKRRSKKLNADLLTIDISKLKKYKLNSNQQLILRLTLITDNGDKVRIHPDKLKYFSPLIQLNLPNDGSIYIRICQSDIDKGKIELKDLSIIKTRHKMYNFKLISYNLLKISDESETYATDKNKTIMKNVRNFRENFNLKASRIACQILIQEDQLLHLTHIACLTNIMIEKEYERKSKKPVKRVGKKRRNTKNRN